MLDQPGQQHRNGTDTEQASAVLPWRGGQRWRVLVILAESADPIGELPHDFYSEAGCRYPHVATTRCEDLAKLGLAEKVQGERRANRDGNLCEIWRATDEGRRFVAGVRS